jgi:hypothetical protein
VNVTVALAVRRAMVFAGAVGSSLAAHGLAGGVRPTLMTPVALGTLLFLAMLVGGRSSWRPRGALRTAALLVALQPMVHYAVGSAPWLLGMSSHHAAPLTSLPMLAAHVLAVLVASLLIARAERLLSGAIAGIRRVLSVLAPPRRRSGASGLVLEPISRHEPFGRHVAAACPRGPPAAFPIT